MAPLDGAETNLKVDAQIQTFPIQPFQHSNALMARSLTQIPLFKSAVDKQNTHSSSMQSLSPTILGMMVQEVHTVFASTKTFSGPTYSFATRGH